MSTDRSHILWPLQRSERGLESLLNEIRAVWSDSNSQKAQHLYLAPRSAEAEKVVAQVQSQHEALTRAENTWIRVVDTLRLADEASRRCRQEASRTRQSAAETTAHCQAAAGHAHSAANAVQSARSSIASAQSAGSA